MRRSGLAQPEVVFLLAAGLALASAVVPAGYAIRARQRVALARSDVTALLQAGRRFYREYGVWPSSRTGEKGDRRFGSELPNAEVLNILCALDRAGNEAHAVNRKRIVFLETSPAQPGLSGVDGRGEFLDPWGTPYQVVLDTDLNNICEIPGSAYPRQIGQGMLAWSCGPDRRSDTSDDVLSWTPPPGRSVF